MMICGTKKGFFIVRLAQCQKLHYIMVCTLDIVTAESLESVLLVGIISKRTTISRTLVITSKILDLCFSGNSVYVSIGQQLLLVSSYATLIFNHIVEEIFSLIKFLFLSFQTLGKRGNSYIRGGCAMKEDTQTLEVRDLVV